MVTLIKTCWRSLPSNRYSHSVLKCASLARSNQFTYVLNPLPLSRLIATRLLQCLPWKFCLRSLLPCMNRQAYLRWILPDEELYPTAGSISGHDRFSLPGLRNHAFFLKYMLHNHVCGWLNTLLKKMQSTCYKWRSNRPLKETIAFAEGLRFDF